MAQPMLARLREKDPGLRIEALGPPWIAPVLRRMPEVDEVIEADLRHGELQLGERWRLGKLLGARNYDQAVVLPNSFKSALLPFFAGIPERVGYAGEFRYGFVNRVHQSTKAPMALHYARLSEAPGTEPAQPLPATILRARPEATAAAAAKFGIAGPYCVLCPGAEYGPAKRWPYFKELAPKLPLPAQAWASFAEPSSTAGSAGLNLAGKTTLDEAMDLIAGAAFVVSNDSGLMHVAAALGRPLTALYGSSSPEHTPPRSARAKVLWLHPECSPCFARECPLGHFRCMKELGVEQVLEALPKMGTDHDFREQ
jgi:heptosyltransferase-2